MKKFSVKRFAKHGEVVKTSIEVDGVSHDIDHRTSRLITETTDEGGSGLFVPVGDVKFHRGNAEVTVTFEEFKFGQSNAWEIRAEIIKRCKAIDAAFEAKYPPIDEVAASDDMSMSAMAATIPSFVPAFQGIQSFNAAECLRVTGYIPVSGGIDSALMDAWHLAHDEFTPDQCDDLFAVFTTNGMHVAFFNKCVLVFSGHSVLCVTKYAFEHYKAVLEMEKAMVAIYKCPSLFIFNNVSL
jgi:hypothetical protein